MGPKTVHSSNITIQNQNERKQYSEQPAEEYVLQLLFEHVTVQADVNKLLSQL